LVEVDGSFGEGGGQIIRSAVTLAALTGQAVTVSRVRAGRKKPGLQPQHLTAVRAAARICNATLRGDTVGSFQFTFEPQSAVQPGQYEFDIGTAGAAPLVAQTVFPPLACAEGPSRVSIRGGTHVPHAPPAEYLEGVYFPLLQAAGLGATFHYERPGFFPRGGGLLERV